MCVRSLCFDCRIPTQSGGFVGIVLSGLSGVGRPSTLSCRRRRVGGGFAYGAGVCTSTLPSGAWWVSSKDFTCTNKYGKRISGGMRPQVPEDVADRVEELVDEKTRVPAASVSFAEQLEILVEVAEERDETTPTASVVDSLPDFS